MSGFLAVIAGPAHKVDEVDLKKLGARLRFRAPGSVHVCCEPRLGLVQADLADPAGRIDQGIPSLDGRYQAVGSVRLDDEDGLRRAVGPRPEGVERTVSQLELAVRAYARWGEACLDRLQGDFAFLIWDKVERRAFCARDRFGVRQLYYAEFGDTAIFGNTLEVILAHPAVAVEQDEASIADFLLFGGPAELDQTSFKGVRRLPPAHMLVKTASGIHRRRYWTLEPMEAERGVPWRTAPTEFLNRLRESVVDRIGSGPVGVFMSGGLDSTSVALLAARSRDPGGAGASVDVGAHTWVIDDAEGWAVDAQSPARAESRYAALVAKRAGLDHRVHTAGPGAIFAGWRDGAGPPVEPLDLPFLDVIRRAAAALAREGPVALTGQGGDPCLMAARQLAWTEVRRLRLLRLLTGAARHVRLTGRVGGLGLRSSAASRWGSPQPTAGIPPWFDPDFARRNDVEERWEAWHRRQRAHHREATPGEARPEARAALTDRIWPLIFWSLDEEITRQPLWVRHPFFDLRVLDFALRLAALPWFVDKLLLRRAMEGLLPETTLERSKSVDAYDIRLRALKALSLDTRKDLVQALDSLHGIVSVPLAQRLLLSPERLRSSETHFLTRPLALAYWADHWVLRRRTRMGEPCHERPS